MRPSTRALVPALRRHVLELAAAGGVAVEFANGRRAAAYRGSPSRGLRPRIRVPEIRGQVTYFTALHELGGAQRKAPQPKRQRLLYRHADSLTDDDLDRLVAEVGTDRIMRALDRLTQPSLPFAAVAEGVG